MQHKDWIYKKKSPKINNISRKKIIKNDAKEFSNSKFHTILFFLLLHHYQATVDIYLCPSHKMFTRCNKKVFCLWQKYFMTSWNERQVHSLWHFIFKILFISSGTQMKVFYFSPSERFLSPTQFTCATSTYYFFPSDRGYYFKKWVLLP